MKTEEMIEVMQAFVDGKAIQVRHRGFEAWQDINQPLWDWSNYFYRVRPKVIKSTL